MDRVKLLAGRLFNPADPHAVMISQALAGREHLQPGGTLHLIGYPQRDGNADVTRAVRLAFRVSAIVVTTTDRASHHRWPGSGSWMQPGVRPYPPGPVTFNPAGGGVTCCSGAALPLLRSRGRPSPWPRGTGWELSRSSTSPRMRAARAGHQAASGGPGHLRRTGRSDRPGYHRAVAAPPAHPDSAENSRSCGFGMSRSSLVALSLARVALVTTPAAVLAVGVAVTASPLMPIGPARFAEPSPGIEVNLAILGAGFLIFAIVPLLALAPAAARAAPGPGRSGWPSQRPPCASPGWPRRWGRPVPYRAWGYGWRSNPVAGAPRADTMASAGTTGLAFPAVVAAMVFGASFPAWCARRTSTGRTGPSSSTAGGCSIPASRACGSWRFSRLTGYAGGNYGQVSVAAQACSGTTCRDWDRLELHGTPVPDPSPATPRLGPGLRPGPAHPAHARSSRRTAGRSQRERQDIQDAGGRLGGVRGFQHGRRQFHRPGHWRRGGRPERFPARIPRHAAGAHLL